MPRRCVLTTSVLNAIPAHKCQAFKLPTLVVSHLDKIRQGFVWNHKPSQRRMHHCSWDCMIKPKTKGGLGLKNLSLINNAFFGLITHSSHTPTNAQWFPPPAYGAANQSCAGIGM
ncbi:hypothetical protein FRX31_014908, partial [Thalictrum thalictroides]